MQRIEYCFDISVQMIRHVLMITFCLIFMESQYSLPSTISLLHNSFIGRRIYEVLCKGERPTKCLLTINWHQLIKLNVLAIFSLIL